MITADGYSKDPNIVPEGIVVTWGKDMINLKGGLLNFIRFFEANMKTEQDLWLQKCKNTPQQDIVYVYVIVCNQLRYRCYYGGHQSGPANIRTSGENTFSRSMVINWPRVILAGPFEKAPIKRTIKGFQGFRYCTKLF